MGACVLHIVSGEEKGTILKAFFFCICFISLAYQAVLTMTQILIFFCHNAHPYQKPFCSLGDNLEMFAEKQLVCVSLLTKEGNVGGGHALILLEKL